MSPAPAPRPSASFVAARPSRTRKAYELWRDADGNYSFFPRENAPARDAVGQGELVWCVEAESWEEAVAAQRQYLGWGG